MHVDVSVPEGNDHKTWERVIKAKIKDNDEK